LCDPTEAKEFSDDVTVIETYPSFAIVDMPAQRAQELGKKYPIEELQGFFLGNDFDNAGSFDHINNVEGVIVDEPTAGEWRVEVVASEVEVDPQHLAVVISGPGVTRQ